MTNEAPTPDEVEKAISRLHGRADCSSVFGDVKKSMQENEELSGTIRAHIAALEAELATYRRNDKSGVYSNRSKDED